MEAERIAEARVVTAGFLVRRQLRSWLGPGKGSSDDLETWLRKVQNAHTFGQHIDRAEKQILEMLAFAKAAPPEVTDAVDEAAALFFNGTEWLTEFAATPRPRGGDIADWVNLRDMAWNDLARCVTVIDTRLPTAGLLQTARRYAAETQAEYPTTERFLKRAAGKLENIHRN